MDVVITPEPTEEEAAAIAAAVTLGTPKAAARQTDSPTSRWRFSGRWWAKPLPQRRGRPT